MYFVCRKSKTPTPIAPLLSEDPIYSENKGDIKIDKLYENESQFSLDFSKNLAAQTSDNKTSVLQITAAEKVSTEIKDSGIRNVEHVQ